MSDRVTGDGQSETSSASSEPARSMSRIGMMLRLLLVFGLVAMGVIVFDIGIGNVHGWDWAWAVASVFVVSCLFLYQRVVTGIMGLLKGIIVLCVIMMVACGVTR